MTSTLPPYVERGGEQVFSQPVQLSGASFYSYLLKADADAVQAACDRYLNGPAKGAVHYRAVLPFVVLGVVNIERITSLVPPDAGKGYISEADAAFWVLVARIKKVAGIPVVEKLAWFIPYMFVTHPWATACGREIFGFPKEQSVLCVPKGPTDPATVTVDTFVLPAFSPTTPAVQARLIEVRRTDGGPFGETSRVWTDADTAFKEFIHRIRPQGGFPIPGLGLIVELWDFLVHHEMPLVFLKQFRDAANGLLACYQSIVECPARLVRFGHAGLLAGSHEVDIKPYASHPIVQELGLAGPVSPVELAWHVDFDFIMENGVEVWKA
jgi:hypothetical protein